MCKSAAIKCISRHVWDGTVAMNPPEFLSRASQQLKLPRSTLATALLYYHSWNLDPIDQYMLSLTCLSLASKHHEKSLKLRDFLNVGYRILHIQDQDQGLLSVGDDYFDMRDSICSIELLLLRVLDFNLGAVETAFHYIDDMIDEYLKIAQLDSKMSDNLEDSTRSLIADAYSWDKVVDYHPRTVAFACLYIVCSALELTLPVINDSEGFVEKLSRFFVEKLNEK